jgi:Uma2 family endonuclease
MAVIRETIERYENQTVADLELLPEGTLAELIEGVILMSPAPTVLHQFALTSILFELTSFVRSAHGGYVLSSPLDVHLAERYVLQPDIIYIAPAHAELVRKDAVYGAPDLVIEILSPSTGYYDLTKKRDAYERFGVKEYWIVDPERKQVEVLVLEAGSYRSDQTITAEGTARSVLLDGFEVNVPPLFELRDHRRGK